MIGLLIWRLGQYSPFLYRGGLVAAVGRHGARSWPPWPARAAWSAGPSAGAPLRWIGVRSYGIYLWHYPVIVLTTPPNAGENLPRAAAQIAASVVMAALSWRFIEEPVRHGAHRPGLGAGRRAHRAQAGAPGPPGCAGLAALTGAGRRCWSSPESAWPSLAVPARVAARRRWPWPPALGLPELDQVRHQGRAAVRVRSAARSRSTARGRRARRRAGRAAVSAGRPAGRCAPPAAAVAHIGDSTSDGLVSPDYLPNPAAPDPRPATRTSASRSVRIDISGGRSIVEVLPGPGQRLRRRAQDMVRAGLPGLLGARPGHRRHRRRGRGLRDVSLADPDRADDVGRPAASRSCG